MNSSPQISIVAVGRNDNYGGDFKSRLQSFVSWTHKQLTIAKISSELIFVNYNPIEGVAIESFISWPASNDWVHVRVITVPQSQHKQVVSKHGLKNVPVLEYIAKNIGIRRAKGEFVLAMNPDILIAESTFSKFKNLDSTAYYRANRLDYSGSFDVDSNSNLYEQLRENVKTIWFMGSHTDIDDFSYPKYVWSWLSKSLENGWRRNTIHFEKILNYFSIPVYYHNIEYRYHCNASGDFMLMSRENWVKLKGYKENSFIALHVDSLMVIQAAFYGLGQKTFFSPVYHKQHERRYDAINKDSEDQQKVYKAYKNDVEKMDSTNEALIYNDHDWGHEGVNFAEL